MDKETINKTIDEIELEAHALIQANETFSTGGKFELLDKLSEGYEGWDNEQKFHEFANKMKNNCDIAVGLSRMEYDDDTKELMKDKLINMLNYGTFLYHQLVRNDFDWDNLKEEE